MEEIVMNLAESSFEKKDSNWFLIILCVVFNKQNKIKNNNYMTMHLLFLRYVDKFINCFWLNAWGLSIEKEGNHQYLFFFTTLIASMLDIPFSIRAITTSVGARPRPALQWTAMAGFLAAFSLSKKVLFTISKNLLIMSSLGRVPSSNTSSYVHREREAATHTWLVMPFCNNEASL